MSKCCGQGDVLLFACSGGSNVGQISNDAAKALDQLGQGSFYCLNGVGAQLPNFVERIKKDGTTVVAIDGCGVGCAKKALANVGAQADAYVVVTDLGIEKGHHFNHTPEEVGKTAQAVVDALKTPACSCNG
ncbi:MAG TPA: putative zinc-binding protein [Armatimonadota bacterium]